MSELTPALEAILMVTDVPVTVQRFAEVLEVSSEEIEDALRTLVQDYEGRGFELREVAGGWRIFSRPQFGDLVGKFVLEGQTSRLTQAALETLAIVAYRQPVSRSRVAAIRGVNVDSVVRTLVTRGLITESGVDPESGATLYQTTPAFLERLGISSISELPPISPLLPGIDALDEFEDNPEGQFS
ncbi:SMC-Scp complex subunit ScpB [Neomicrococcus aestuarii]|uniref:SMC-Scp complex subunit ScpB n=1 Tax=Neomicrococcus aestuarii TaxID=556325 RepID=A0A1L2ZM74_9MICC|nr:SMC-Scp complex subunit ScpB [Neomicrococcus aestuarii]APF40249.1 SMC-Scp complex subunit ScpB [Neomicrococcus aestuarii]MBB5511714.1 segregation and condensation protein B [Neomicrococcus aestuarii]